MTDTNLKLDKAVKAFGRVIKNLDKMPKYLERNKENLGNGEWKYYLNQLEKIEQKIYLIRLALSNM